MTPKQREIETLLLTAFAAVPLYGTRAVGILPVALFHVAIVAIAIRVSAGKGPELIPEGVLRAVAIAYVPFYLIDAAVISRSAIAASTHLVLFIAIYQPIESLRKNNHAQRLLTTALIFIASVATSTHISIVLFVIAFSFLMFRQMMYVSHVETVRMIGHEYAEAPSSRAAMFYLCGTTIIGAALFPVLPRIRSPIVQGMTGALTNASTGLSDTIDFSQARTGSNDATVVARVWMGQEAIPFFTPLRLRGPVYDRFQRNQWVQSRRAPREIRPRRGAFRVAQPSGFTRSARVQERFGRNQRLLLPSGTYAVGRLATLWEGPGREAYYTYPSSGDVVFEAYMARSVSPLPDDPPPHVIAYPASPQLTALAREMIGDATQPLPQAQRVESYMLRNYQYLAIPEQLGKRMTVDEFLLRDRRGHCEYFAAGMVTIMSTLGVPARIVGGFYGGRLNPLTGYFTVRREDAHAWVEVWDGETWRTFDPTPPTLRPGNVGDNLIGLYLGAISDSVNYFWDRYVLTFGLGDQVALAMEAISRTRRALSTTRSGIASIGREFTAERLSMLAAVIGAIVLLGFLIVRRRRSTFDLLAEHLRRLGIEVGPAMTMEEALARVREQHPEAARDLASLIELYEAERFSPDGSEARRAVRRRLAELKT